MKAVLVSAIGLLIALVVVAQTPSDHPKPPEIASVNASGLMKPAQFGAVPSKPADYRSSYGTDANQFGGLRVPSGVGPHPVVILIHGGCWRAEFAKLSVMGPMADALNAKGIATWNVEFPRGDLTIRWTTLISV